ncbi:hypothetical protein BgiMline_001704 [Biomphalaria glabrata]|nr:CAunnamed protein product [Biomphalaria glabrata]
MSRPNVVGIILVILVSIRESICSVRSNGIKMEKYKLSDRLVLHKVRSRDAWCWPSDPSKILVIFFPWLNAKEKHITKYRELYAELGLDVLTVKSKNSHFLWPPNSVRLAQHVDEVLQKNLSEYEHYICHSMSAGAYNLTVLGMCSRDKDQGTLLKKFKAIVLDSVVVGTGRAGVIKDLPSGEESNALDKMIKGVATSISSSRYVHSLVALLSKVYFGLTKKYTLDFYEKSVDAVCNKPVLVPTLVIGSKDDQLSDAAVTEQVVKIWKSRNEFPVTLHMFDHSQHAQHYMLHKKEYTAIHRKFLDEVFSHVSFHGEGNSSYLKSKL